MCNFRFYRSSRDRDCQLTAGLALTCPQTEVNNHPVSLGLTYGQYTEFASFVGFLKMNYNYKSVATEVSHDAELAPIQYTS